MPKAPLRRANLINPFGVGSLHVTRSGISLITAGLDYWYEKSDGSSLDDRGEFVRNEWRLEKSLRVNEFRIPPDYRTSKGGGCEKELNKFITVPALRFPTTHFCPSCRSLESQSLTVRDPVLLCENCKSKKYTFKLFQVQIITMCEGGHVGEFPWREWVHRSTEPACSQTMRLMPGAGGQQGDQIVKCSCGLSRRLGNIWLSNTDGTTYLSNNLLEKNEEPFLCRGTRPWIGDSLGEGCDQHMRAAFRSDSNLYFAKVASSLYIPRSTADVTSDLIAILECPHFSPLVQLGSEALKNGEVDESFLSKALRDNNASELLDFTDDQLIAAIKYLQSVEDENREDPDNEDDVSFRYDEFKVLRKQRDESELKIREPGLEKYEQWLQKYFKNITLVDKLRETRVLTGFSRVNPPDPDNAISNQDFMFRQPPRGEKRWLPANIVYGEGIYLELRENEIKTWETRPEVNQRIQPIIEHNQNTNFFQDSTSGTSLFSRFFLIHTFAHLLINQLTFDCGYSSASLRERLYVSNIPGKEMAALLIYTASGDSDGTLGGLVRMGQPENLEVVIKTALLNARWCSADPVCAELTQQGPNGCNLAACHSCALVPETSCEQFNRFLDRNLVVSGLQGKPRGYFKEDLLY